MDFSFLTSNRFIVLIVGSLATVLLDPEFPNQEWYISLGKFLQIIAAGFIAVRTIDRATEVLSNRSLPVAEDGKKKK